MNTYAFSFADAALVALPSGALYWPEEGLLVVSDLHLGKAGRMAQVGGAQLPPYEARETLARLEADLEATRASRVICLGDSFDRPELGHALPEDDLLWITRLQAGRDWIWVEGNHDPGPMNLGGTHRIEVKIGSLVFRHIAQPDATGEVSGHYHPKARIPARGRLISRPCFLFDTNRLILPAYGTYTGGLCTTSNVLSALMAPNAQSILTGKRALAVPMPRARPA
ncbi:MAG: ligase-associated DNA damage response endonuclease PdeM [Paracoccaceae bacterium]|nr:ligase-associated DNA damage response endonuclease PdeM [Paracoccaceae bacterium]